MNKWHVHKKFANDVSWVRGEESGDERRGRGERRTIETKGAEGGGWVEAGRTRPRPLAGKGSQVTGQGDLTRVSPESTSSREMRLCPSRRSS